MGIGMSGKQAQDIVTASEATQTAAELLDDAIGTHDSDVSTKVIVLGGKAETGTPSDVSDGDDVRIWVNEKGQIVIAGYNASDDAIDVSRIGGTPKIETHATVLNAVTAAGASAGVNCRAYRNVTFLIYGTGVTVDGNIFNVQYSGDDSNYTDYPSATETIDIADTGEWRRIDLTNIEEYYLRIDLDTYTAGTYTVIMLLGN